MSAVLSAEKQRLRALLRTQRRNLTPGQVAEKSRVIVERLCAFSLFQNAKLIVSYASDANEVQTEAVWDAAQPKAVYYPRISADRTRLDFVQRSPDEPLLVGLFGIRTPPGNERLTAGQARDAIVLTPGLGFDVQGRRLGRGRGYYDRAFCHLLAGAVRVALAYDHQVLGRIPSGPLDERVNWILTESRLIDCRANPRRKRLEF